MIFVFFKILVNDAAKLREMYPGPNADAIVQQQSAVVNSWEALKKCALERKERLTASLEFHGFMSAVSTNFIFFMAICQSFLLTIFWSLGLNLGRPLYSHVKLIISLRIRCLKLEEIIT
jgi:hypothetical protein